MAERRLVAQADESWELDALPVIGEATAISDVIANAIDPLVDWDSWHQARAQADREQLALKRMARNWDRADDMVQQAERFERVEHYVATGGGGL